jgi:hypothetical protein
VERIDSSFVPADLRILAQDFVPDSARGDRSVVTTHGHQAMFYLLLLLGFIAMAAGVFVIGFGIPIRETSFGAALLTSGSIAITGGFVLVGLAAAVRELKRVAQALKARSPRPVRPAERRDGERAGSDRRSEPRLPMPGALGAEVPNAVSTKLDASDTQELWSKPGPEWLRRAVAEVGQRPSEATFEPDRYHAEESQRASDTWPRNVGAPSLDNVAAEERRVPGTSTQSMFDTWSLEQRSAEATAEQPTEESLETEVRPAEAKSPPMVPAPPPVAPVPAAAAPSRSVRIEPRQLPVLKSGVIDNMAYTLFTDGSIEAQMPDGIMRFASIEALRKHLQKNED